MFVIDAVSRQPVYEQIVTQMERLVLTGVLRPGDQVPSVRALSTQLSINPTTIQKAYTALDHAGLLCAVPGRGCFVAANAPAVLAERYRQQLSTLRDQVCDLVLAGVKAEEIRRAVEEGLTAALEGRER